MAVSKLDVIEQYFDNDGLPAAGFKLYTYAAGTSTLLATYTDNTGTIANSNPIIGDASARCQTWFTVGTAYKVILRDANDVPLETVDGILINAGGSGGTTTPPTDLSLSQDLEFEFLGGDPPRTLETMGGKAVNRALTFPANFSGSSGHCDIPPTAAFVITVKLNGGSIGTITISTARVFTFATTASAAVSVVAGDYITFHAQVAVDATLADLLWVLVADVA